MTALFRKLDLEPDGRRTPDGDPWVSWRTDLPGTPSWAGWAAPGSRAPATLGGTSHFWRTVVGAVSVLLGGGIDQAFTAPGVILAGGALGSTLASGALQDLLHECLLLEPARTVEVLAPLYHATGVYTHRSLGGTQLRQEPRTALVSEQHLSTVVTLNGTYGRWSELGKRRAQLWVSTVSRLLRDERMDAAQLRHAERWLPPRMRPEVAQAVRWTADSTEASWQYTSEQQYLWAVALTLSAEVHSMAPPLFAGLKVDDPYDAVAMVEQLHQRLRATGGLRRYRPVLGVLGAAFSIGEVCIA